MTRWGISYADHIAIREKFGFAPFKAFDEQRYSAGYRLIPFNLTFSEWWELWQTSGQWKNRGRGTRLSYVMARLGDSGPYAIGNVRIITMGENMVEYHSLHGKLDVEKVKVIRTHYKAYDKHSNMSAFATRYGVSREAIRDVLSYKTWTHV